MANIDNPTSALGLPCVHCGLCLDSCPTYRVSGVEAESPRGRIYIMDAVASGDIELDNRAVAHLDSCLGCLACESACPSGVSYGQRLEQFRPRLAQAPRYTRATLRRVVSRRVASSTRLLRTALGVAHGLDALGLSAIRRRLPGLALLPARDRRHRSSRGRGCHTDVPVPQTPRMRVALLRGCVADTLAPEINDAAIEVLHRNNIAVVEFPGQQCCGALALHAGRHQEALSLATANARAFTGARLDAVVTTAAGCGAVVKDYGRLLKTSAAAADGRTLAGATHDVCELLVSQGFRQPRIECTHTHVAYHDACHLLHAQHLSTQPRRITAAALGHEPVDLGENSICCGSAGSYNLDEPAMGRILGASKARLVSRAGVTTLAVANVGCILQIERALAVAAVRATVAHPVELLAQAYRRERYEPGQC